MRHSAPPLRSAGQKAAVPWRELGRVDLEAGVLTQRLEGFIESLFDRYA